MKKVSPDKIINIENTDTFDNKFLFDYLECDYASIRDVEVIYLSDLLEFKRNEEVFDKVEKKPAMYSNVYSPEDELAIFTELFNDAINNNKKIHIVWITLDAEVKMLEEYYTQLGFMREDINCFDPDFKIPLVTASVKIENIMWKWSDYKAQGEKIYFNPPVRESWEVKAMFKWINRWVTAGIYISKKTPEIESFLSEQVKTEKILPIAISKLLKYNLESIWFTGRDEELVIEY
jgi:hypothetical protein